MYTRIEPTEQVRVFRQHGSFPRQRDEDVLRGLLGSMAIAGQLAKRRAVDEIDSSLYELGKRRVGTLVGESAKEIGIGHGSMNDSRAAEKTAKKKRVPFPVVFHRR